EAGAREVVMEWPEAALATQRWIAAVRPDRLDVRAAALGLATARDLGLPPAVIAALAGTLRAAAAAGVPARVILRVGRTSVADLDVAVLDAMAGAARRASLELLLVPRLGDGEERLRLDQLALRA